MSRVSICLLILTLLALVGCKRGEPIATDQPPDSFKTDTENSLSKIESRIADVRKQISKLTAETKDRATSAVELAEEKIETLRQTSLAHLVDASREQLPEMKSTINRTLAEIQDHVASAESAVKEGLSSQNKFATDVRGQLDELRKRRENLKSPSVELNQADKDRLVLALESAEEAIQEAGNSLNRYLSAAQDAQPAIQDNIQSLLAEARTQLDGADKIIQAAKAAQPQGSQPSQ